MPEYLAPGVYVEEISAGPRPIEGVGTSTAGFLGMTERGPEYPRLITSWLEFQRWYGGYIPEQSYLAYAVQGFFENGGQRCFIGRIVGDNAQPTAADVGNLMIMAVGRGMWGNRLRVRVDPATQANADAGRDWFRIRIVYYRTDPDPFVDPTDPDQLLNPNRVEPDVLEDFDNLTHITGASNNVETVINAASHLVRVWWNDAGAARVPDQALTPLGANGSDGATIAASDFDGNLDPIVRVPRDLLGRGRGLAGLSTVDEVALLLAPDEVRNNMQQVTNNVINQCELLKDRFAIVSVNQGASDVNPLRPPRDTTYAAFYHPWIYVYDPLTNRPLLIPPSGHIAGIFARSDIERGVHKAPANEVVRGALNPEFTVTKGMQDILNPRGVNCIRDFRSDGRGIRLWGARTMSSDPEWKYVNVRRLFLFVEESIDEGAQWVVFEPNHEPTWAKVRRSVTNFLITVWRSGALMGTTQDEAFFVKCDRTTMTEDDINNGRLICYIGIAPVRPAEFVIFRISQKTIEATG
ncbi:MAG: phage tail sheath family protein [Chloroflexales bacterium]|nr:phage tail sheath family protein [Chloroflexales bacterium]